MMKIYVGGTFDCFHHGHVRLFKSLKNAGEDVVVIAAVNGDAFALKYKNKLPIMNEVERCEVVEACKYVDLAFIMRTHEDQRKYIEIFNPTFIAHGTDWRGDSLLKQLNIDDVFLKENNIKMMYPESTAGISTTEILRRFLVREDLDIR